MRFLNISSALTILALLLSSCSLFTPEPMNARFTIKPGQYLVAFNARKNADEGYHLGLGVMDSLDGDLKIASKPLPRSPKYTHVAKPYLVFGNNRFYLYYSGFYEGHWEIGLLTSHDGINWLENPNGPVLVKGDIGTWDSFEVSRPVVVFEPNDIGREFKLWYRGNDGHDNGIGYAFSSDGIHFTKHGSQPVARPGFEGTFDASNISPEAIFTENNTYYLFYQASASPNLIQGGLFTFTDARGPYSTYSNNPVVRTRPTATQEITKNANSSETTLFVNDSSVFENGEPIMISSSNQKNWEVNRIILKPSTDSVTLEKPIIQDYLLEDAPFADSLMRRKVYPTYVWKESDTWHFFATVFQPRQDGGVREFTARAFGASIDNVQWDFFNSPIFEPANSLQFPFYRESLENLSVIRIGK